MQNLPFEPEFEQAYKGMSLVFFSLYSNSHIIIFFRHNLFPSASFRLVVPPGIISG